MTTQDLASEPRLTVAEAPHWHEGGTLAGMQAAWLLALTPAIAAAVILHGLPAARVLGLTVGLAVLLDAGWNRLVANRDPVGNLSSITLGVLLALMLPLGAPWWLILVACLLAVVVGKKIFGGWGGYPVHPVALSLAMLTLSWPARLAAPLVPGGPLAPLRLARTAGPEAAAACPPLDLLLGHQAGGVGSALPLWLLLGGVALILLRQVPWQIPCGFVGGVAACAWGLRLAAPDVAAAPWVHLLAGSTVLTACFLAPEQSTSPVNRRPMFLYGLLGGVLLVLIRTYSQHEDGAIFTVLLMNVAAPLLDRMTPRVRGAEAPGRA